MNAPTAREIVSWPLPPLSWGERAVVRSAALMLRSRVAGIDGVENILPERGPFVLVANHSTRLEALVLPLMLLLLRGGQHVHFLSDWNFQLIPGLATLFRVGQVITVPNKPAKPAFLNAFKPLIVSDVPPMDQARRKLAAGHPVGIFPEGTVNRDPVRLLRGRKGAARLSVEMGVPVVPVGLTFPEIVSGVPVPDGTPIHIRFGAAMHPPAGAALADWHIEIMRAIAALCGKILPSDTGARHEDLRAYANQAG